MNGIGRWIFSILVIAVLSLTGCTQAPGKTAEKIAPVRLEPVAETGLNRVVLTENAAKRLNIQTAPVWAEQMERKRLAWGEVVAFPEMQAAAPDTARVLVSLNASDTDKVDRGSFALISLLDDEDDEEDEDDGLEAELDDGDDDRFDDEDEDEAALYYLVDNASHNLVPGQRVRVLLPLLGSGAERTVVPYSAVIYDLNGKTWVYTNPEPLVFTRYPVVIDYIEDDEAFLVEGPPVGTIVATVGVPELYGADTGVGK